VQKQIKIKTKLPDKSKLGRIAEAHVKLLEEKEQVGDRIDESTVMMLREMDRSGKDSIKVHGREFTRENPYKLKVSKTK